MVFAVPNDPRAKRQGPAPNHRSGYPASEDAPVHVAPPVDVRSSSSSSSMPAVRPPREGKTGEGKTGEGQTGEEEDSVPFGLAFPVEERVSQRPAPADEDVEAYGPRTVEYGRSSPAPAPSPSSPSASPPRVESTDIPPHWRATSEPPSAEGDRDALLRDLVAIGPLEENPDRAADREVAGRATLARARALRFRLMLHDVWPPSAWPQAQSAATQRPLHIDVALDAALILAVADGAPSPKTRPQGAYSMPFVKTVVDFLRAMRPDLPRSALRDRGSASIARITIVGYKSALEQLVRAGRSVPEDARRTALELAARVAHVPALNDHRFAALSDLERALVLPTGSVAVALDLARKPL
jgi:hypothetical protein